MSDPAPGTNIHTIWTKVLTDVPLSNSQLKEKLTTLFPEISPKSLHVHIKSLIKRGFASKETMGDGQVAFRRHKLPIQPDLIPDDPIPKRKPYNKSKPLNLIVLNFLKKHVGKSFTAGEVKAKLKLQGSGVWDIMKTFAKEGLLEFKTINNRNIYTVLPAIIECSHPPTTYNPANERRKKKTKAKREIIHATVEPAPPPLAVSETDSTMPDIANLSIGEILNNFIAMRDENIRLRQTIENMVHMAVTSGVVEQE